MDSSGNATMSPKVFLGCLSALLITVLLYPWIIFMSFLSFFLGYYLLDGISEKLRQAKLSSLPEKDVKVYKLDPLLHPTPFNDGDDLKDEGNDLLRVEKHGSSVTCSVCDIDNCKRADQVGINVPDQKVELVKEPRILCVDLLLDQAIARFCASVFDYYISTSWAPYETRKQLKLAFKRLLTNFGERLEVTLVQDKKAVSFCEEKVIPLCIHYLEKIKDKRRRPSAISSQVQRKERERLEKFANLKTRRLCRQLLEYHLPLEYQQCKLGMELCVSVLADGVLWNLILLGRNKLPGLFFQLAADCKRTSDTCATPAQNLISIIYAKASDYFSADIAEAIISSVNQNINNAAGSDCGSRKTSMSKVPLLLGSFLDPVNDLYQPDVIFSRWRPTLDEILKERDLLYCLIQYLKGQQTLEYLQAVLDESPDGNKYCKHVLQLEYLPGFCRSKYFMETLGISQVDCALEAGSDSPGTKRKQGHSRSNSYGGGNSGIQIWKIGDPKAVDGLPLHANPAIQAVSYDSEPLHRPRQFSLEQVIGKFLLSTTSPLVVPQITEKPKRVGINSKSYEDYAADEVASQLVLGNCDIYDSASEVAIMWLNRRPWIQPVLSGWTQMLRPHLKPQFDILIKSLLEQSLSVRNCVYLINLITDAFLGITNSGPEKSPDDSKDLNSVSSQSQESHPSSLPSLIRWFLNQFVDPESFAQAVKENDDEIILFFVDLLDLLVNQICSRDKK